MRKFGLIGYPLGHSWSADMFNSWFKAEGIDARYDLYPIPSIDVLDTLVGGTPDLCGFNVTIPYKQAVISRLDSLSDEAREAGAVNTVLIERDLSGKRFLRGYNTDITGFMRAIKPLTEGMPSCGRQALVLGSGGASGAVCTGLRRMGWTPVVVSRTPSAGKLGYSELTPEFISRHLLVINTTPLGMYPETNEAPPFPYQYLSAAHRCFDAIYNPETTLFMRICSAHGCRVMNGADMLRFQAEDARKVWKI